MVAVIMKCAPAPVRRLVKEDFKGALGAFTPCFTDIVILGANLIDIWPHAVLCFLCGAS